MSSDQYFTQLCDILLNDGGLHRMLMDASRIMGRPIFLEETHGKLLDYAAVGNTIQEAEKMLRKNYCREKHGIYYRWLPENSRFLEYPTVHFKDIFPINYQHRTIALLILGGSHIPHDEAQSSYMSLLINFIAMELSRTPDLIAPSYNHEFLLIELLLGHMNNPSLILSRAKLYGIDMNKQYQLMVITVPTTSAEQFENAFLTKFGINFYVKFGADTVLLVPCDSLMQLCDAEVTQFMEILREMDCYAGVSLPFSNFLKLDEKYRQAEMAVKLGMDGGKPSQRVFFYKDHMTDHMICECLENMEPRQLLHPAFVRLIEFDHENGTEYLSTAHAIVTGDGNLRHTADKLHLHLNTLYYRLKKIEEITGRNIMDGETAFLFSLSFKILSAAKGENHGYYYLSRR